MTSIVIVGGGGFGREVIEILRATTAAGGADWTVDGVVDDFPSKDLAALVARLGTTVLGNVDWLLEQPKSPHVVIAIGDARVRAGIAQRLERVTPVYPVVVHPDSTVGRDVQLGEGTVVAPGARLSTHVTVGRHVHIDQNVTVGHDTTIGDFARLNPQACVSGSVAVGPGALVGASATVLQGLHVGAGAVLGAGCVVVRDVSEGSTVKGVPAQ